MTRRGPGAAVAAGRGSARRAMLDSMSEDELLAALRAAAKQFGWLAYHTHNSRNSADGFPDLVLVKDGRMLCWELKTAGRCPTAAQQEWLDALAGCGVQARVVRPGDYDECFDLLSTN